MRQRREPRLSGSADIWPGYVDALSTLLLVTIFLLVVFVLGQFLLNQVLQGRDKRLDELSAEVLSLTSSLETVEDRESQLARELDEKDRALAESAAAREELDRLLAALRADLDRIEQERDDLTTQNIDAAQQRQQLEQEIQTLTLIRSELDAELAAIETQLDSQRNLTSDLEQRLADASNNLSDGQQALQLSQSARDAQQDRMRRMVARILAYRAELEDTRSSGSTERDELAARIEQQKLEIDEYISRLVQLVEERDALREENETLRDEIVTLSTESTDEVASLEQQRSGLDDRLRETLDQMLALRSDYQRLEALKDALDQDIIAAATTRQNLLEDLAERDATLAAREEELATLNALLAARDLELSESRDALSSSNEDLSERDTRLSRLRAELSARNDALTSSLSTLSEREEALALIQARLAESEDSLKDNQTVLTAREEALAAVRAELAELNSSLTSRESAITAKEEELARKNAELFESNRALQARNAQLEAQAEQLAELQSQQQDLSGSVSNRDVTIRQLRDLIDSLAKERRALGEAQDVSETREAELTRQIEALQAVIADQNRLLDDRARESANAESRLLELSQQVELVTGELDSAERRLELERDAVAARDSRINDIESQLNEALASQVEQLRRFRSDFFGRVRELIAERDDLSAGIQIEGDRFVFPSEVLFSSGQAQLNITGQGQLGDLATTLQELIADLPPDLPWLLRIDGHTDDQPINTARFPSNWELSSARAIAVLRFLRTRGIPPERMAATGFASFQPIDAGNNAVARERNRRIEIKLTTR